MVVALRLLGDEFTVDAMLSCMLNFAGGEKRLIDEQEQYEPFTEICGHCLQRMGSVDGKKWCVECYDTVEQVSMCSSPSHIPSRAEEDLLAHNYIMLYGIVLEKGWLINIPVHLFTEIINDEIFPSTTDSLYLRQIKEACKRSSLSSEDIYCVWSKTLIEKVTVNVNMGSTEKFARAYLDILKAMREKELKFSDWQ